MSWVDDPTQAQTDRYQGLKSYWDCNSAEHRARLSSVKRELVLDKGLPQKEVEDRLMHHSFITASVLEPKDNASKGACSGRT
ncbi:hypothetical protein C6341_g11171 [Phytophthora cactorum]|nr:hypothetical protein PC120_g20846 [Phytophthora cactorum]KAG3169138.1 hypothetical protein C6341_g11171 [Phytophthora cactorum]